MSLHRSLLDDESSLEEAVTFYQHEGDISELLKCLDDTEYRIPALYILSEIGMKARAVWKEIIPYAGDALSANAFHAIDIIQDNIENDDYRVIIELVDSVDLSIDRLFSKMCSLLTTVSSEIIHNLYDFTLVNTIEGVHCLGSFTVINGNILDDSLINKLLGQQNRKLNLYISAFVVRNISKRANLMTHLPIVIQNDFAHRQ